MKRKLLFASSLIAGILCLGVAPALSQEQCPNFSEELIAVVTEKVPCPTSPAELLRFEKAIINRTALITNAAKILKRATRKSDIIDVATLTSQLAEYAAQCRASLGSGEEPQDPGSDPGTVPDGGLASVCTSFTPILNLQMLIKSEISAHINPLDKRATGYTLVCGSQCPQNLRKADFFYADGSYAGSVGYYGRFSGNGKPRLYGAAGGAPQHFARQIAAKAATIGNGKLYIQISAATSGESTICKEFNPTGRNGGI
jgi:hypothetical protein